MQTESYDLYRASRTIHHQSTSNMSDLDSEFYDLVRARKSEIIKMESVLITP